jgi:cell division cycle protein 37
MAKPFDYSKWDKIDLSDDEEDCHPNIDKESWFRMKHRSRVEREEKEAKDTERILKEMDKANQRIKQLQYNLKKLDDAKSKDSDSDDDDDVDLDDRKTIQTELDALHSANATRQAKLDEYEKNKKWNIDNMFEVKEERTLINSNADLSYTPTGFVIDKEQQKLTKSTQSLSVKDKEDSKPAAKSTTTTKDDPPKSATETTVKKSTPAVAATAAAAKPEKPSSYDQAKNPEKHGVSGAFETYHEFTQKHSDRVEEFMALATLEESKQFLLKYGDILLQENACNYLLLASLEDEMNGCREKMKRTARQSQIITNIAELAKTLQTHPGNVIVPFFTRLEQREPLGEFISGVNVFVERIIRRAVVKKAEIDEERRKKEGARDLDEIPVEERLGPGGLDPLEVIQSLPEALQDAFESRDIDELKRVLSEMDPHEAEYHMKRCVDSGLWVAGPQD